MTARESCGLVCFCGRREVLLHSNARLAINADVVRGEEKGKSGQDGGAAGDAAVGSGIRLAIVSGIGRIGFWQSGLGAAGCGGKGADGEDKEDGCADGEDGELRELLTENGRARGPGVEDDDTRQCGGKHQESGVGQGLARHTSWEEAAGAGAVGVWIGTGAPSAAMAATDATDGA